MAAKARTTGGNDIHRCSHRHARVSPAQNVRCDTVPARAQCRRSAHTAARVRRLGARRHTIGSLPGPSRPNKPLQQQEDANVAQRCERTVRRVEGHSFCAELARRSGDALIDFCVRGRMPSCGNGDTHAARTGHGRSEAAAVGSAGKQPQRFYLPTGENIGRN